MARLRSAVSWQHSGAMRSEVSQPESAAYRSILTMLRALGWPVFLPQHTMDVAMGSAFFLTVCSPLPKSKS